MQENAVLTVGNLLGVATGVTISILFPVLLGFIRKEFVVTAGKLPPWAKKYGALAIFSFVTALLVLAVYESTDPKTDLTFLGALLLGFGWESTLEKFMRPPIGLEGRGGEKPATTRSVE